MVRSSPYKSKDKAMRFIDENIIRLLRTFCASETSCRGVSLSLHILRTDCVTKLTPRENRGDYQVISVRELKTKLQEDARKELEGSTNDDWISVDTRIDSCLEYAHCWPEVMASSEHTDVYLPSACERARDLLPENVLEEVREELGRTARNIRRRHIPRRTHENNRPVVLVGHCLGELVIKEVCLQASRSAEVQTQEMSKCANFLTNLKGMFFYSTPHLGWSSKLVDRKLAGEGPPSTADKGDLMETLELWNKRSSRISFQFAQLRGRYGWKTRGVGESNKTEIRTFQDTVSTIMEIVVEEASARSGSLDGFSVIPKTDHFSICRPESVTSDNFLHLVSFIKYLILECMNSFWLQNVRYLHATG